MTEAERQSQSQSALRVEHVSKDFPGQRALDDFGLELRPGEVHALVGQNGSGKSTFIKILSGYHRPEPGARAWSAGDRMELGSATEAERLGLRFIHQDLGLIRGLDAVDNLALGHGYGSRGWIRLGREAREARELLKRFGMGFDVRKPVGELSAAERTIIAVARALRPTQHLERPRVLVLDEPTESLAGPEIDRLFAAIRKVAEAGTAVLYVSHRLREVLSIANRVTVLRGGRIVATQDRGEVDRDRLVHLILGREVEAVSRNRPQAARTGTVLEARDLAGGSVHGVSFRIGKGEIVGLAGIVGSGRDELPSLLGGLRPLEAGEMVIAGRRLRSLSPRRVRGAGLVFVAADRAHESAIPVHTARENLTLPRIPTRGPLRWINNRRERREAAEWMTRVSVVPPEPERVFATFSGGNQQKVVLAQALRLEPTVLVLDEPVQGVDVGAKAALLQMLQQSALGGLAVLVASSDPEDLVAVCDRVIVLADGEARTELSGPNLTVDTIVQASISSAKAEVEQ